MNISDRLVELINNKHVSAYEVSKKTGISEPTMSRILSGKTKKPNLDTLELLAKYFNVSSSWLLTGEGEMLISLEKTEESTDNSIRYLRETIDTKNDVIESKNDLIRRLEFENNQLKLENNQLKNELEASKKAQINAANAPTANVG